MYHKPITYSSQIVTNMLTITKAERSIHPKHFTFNTFCERFVCFKYTYVNRTKGECMYIYMKLSSIRNIFGIFIVIPKSMKSCCIFRPLQSREEKKKKKKISVIILLSRFNAIQFERSQRVNGAKSALDRPLSHSLFS